MVRRYVEVGRLVQIRSGTHKDRAATIVDIVDHNRVLVQNPEANVPRTVVNVKSIDLMDVTIPLKRSASSKNVKKAFKAADAMKKWAETSAAKRVAVKAARTSSSDFDRFRVRRVRRIREIIAKKALKK
eukprot:PhM_4_TR10840/c0_g1_i1/m.67757/K02875/RP-L14e, RPL14; large subunit ribosomal protein L14e